MPLTYHDVMTTQLDLLVDAAKAWKQMGTRFGELKTNFEDHVLKVTEDGSWRGEGFQAATSASGVIKYEYGAAKAEALAIAQILQEAYSQFHDFKQSIDKIVKDAASKGYRVNAHTGEVLYDWESLTPEENRAMKNDPENGRVIAKAERDFTSSIKKLVRKVDDVDQRVMRALTRAVSDTSIDGGGFGGFNAHAEGDLEKAGAPETATRTDGWKSDGKATANGPDVGAVPTGPAYGKQGMLKAHADLGHATAEGSLTNGPVRLSGIGDAYAGARATASAGITDEGVSGNAEVSAGGRAMAEGRLGTKVAGVYGRTTGFAGAEAGADVGLGPDGFSAGGKAFAGAKATAAGGAEAGGVGVGVTGEAWAGPGVEADLTFGEERDDGKFHIGAEVGASPILGGKVGMEFTVDPGKVADTAGDAADAVGDVAGGIGDTAGSVKDTFTGLF